MDELKPCPEKGLYVKYRVTKVEDGSLVDGCFVLRPDRDPAAVEALKAYAAATPNNTLADDIYRWVGCPENKPLTLEEIGRMHWISVSDGLPDIDTPVICYCNNSRLQHLYQRVGYWSTDRSWHDSWDGCEIPVTHWMPLSEPPKEAK